MIRLSPAEPVPLTGPGATTAPASIAGRSSDPSPRLPAAVDRRHRKPVGSGPRFACRSLSRRHRVERDRIPDGSAGHLLRSWLPGDRPTRRRRRRPAQQAPVDDHRRSGPGALLATLPLAWWLNMLTLRSGDGRRHRRRHAHRVLRRLVPVVSAVPGPRATRLSKEREAAGQPIGFAGRWTGGRRLPAEDGRSTGGDHGERRRLSCVCALPASDPPSRDGPASKLRGGHWSSRSARASSSSSAIPCFAG